ncbi:MAG: DUF1003 domain-containing protein [Microbacterium sp.]|uniref:DUF1003 domain-containing protein n=1 Tax=Microbacterium sp. TaxID=51671 RepID=UPI001AC9D025|nr:DUF1003 domain-containing protein [Microbacterium sp.]MBN9171920.1 DUF1003 domain-containing protein [Microbacterium sp.]MBN9187564.1 DUF1003 domain-containing protein [Microbacterium sp.]MBN9191699.1 DUF1003 domain-containing protein [Microbacterium sp.]
MARPSRQMTLDAPRGRTGMLGRSPQPSQDRFGRFSEAFARGMGTSSFLIGMTVFVVVWLAWNTLLPPQYQFDPRAQNFTLLTLILSLQASYAAPLILLAQNRQDDRDRVQIEQDRQRAERNLADTEYLAREVVALRMAMTELTGEVLSRDALRQELKALLEQLDARADQQADASS